MSTSGEYLAHHIGCLGDLSPEDRQLIADLPARTAKLRRGHDTLKSGDHPTEVVIVLTGCLARYSISGEGKRQVHSFYLPTEAPCLETLYLDYMDNSLGAVVNSEVGLIRHEVLYQLIADRPEIRKLLWRQTLVQAAIFREWLMRNSRLPAHAALAHLMCEMFTRGRAAGLVRNNALDLPLNQEILADALGITPVHTNRTLQLLRETGYVDWRSGTLHIDDFDKLAGLAEFDPLYLHLRCP